MKTTARTKVLVSIIAGSALSLFFLFSSSIEAQYLNYDGPARAAIIDQLHDNIPNQNFQEKATEYLKNAGYEVDLYTTKDITIDFYKKLPSMNYKFIVIRSHSAIQPDQDKGTNSVGIFTGEIYQPDKYIYEQIFGQVLKSSVLVFQGRVQQGSSTELNTVTSQSGTYFSIGSKFVDELMLGRFPDSILLIGGCNTLSNTSVADSLLKRGASSIIGWDNTVGSAHNDRVMLEVLKGNLVDKLDVKDVVESSMQTFGPDPEYSAVLKYYADNAAHTRT